MIIFIRNNEDTFQACLAARNMLVADIVRVQSILGRKPSMEHISRKGFVNILNKNKTIIRDANVLRLMRFNRFIRFNILGPFCFACKVISDPKDTKKDKLLFGAKLFGLVLLGIPLGLSVTALILPVALVSHPITHSIGKIKSKIRDTNDEKNTNSKIETIVNPEEVTFEKFLQQMLRYPDDTTLELSNVLVLCKSKYDPEYKSPDFDWNDVSTKLTESSAIGYGNIDRLAEFMGIFK